MAVTDRPVIEPWQRVWWPWTFAAISFAAIWTVAVGLVEGDIGLVFLMGETQPASRSWLTLGFGFSLGLGLSLWGGSRITAWAALAASISLVLLGFFAIFFVGSMIVTAVGVALGALAVRAVRLSKRRPWAGATVSFAVTAGAVLAGVNPPPPPPERPLLNLIERPGGLTVVVDPQQHAPGEGVRGTLGDVGGCLGLVDRPGGEPDLLIVWPDGTMINESGNVEARGRSWSVGDEGVVPGTVLDLSRDLQVYDEDLPVGCRMVPILL